MKLDAYLFELQNLMIKHKPKDYRGDDWEVNVVFWMAMAREQLYNGTITLDVIEKVAYNISQ